MTATVRFVVGFLVIVTAAELGARALVPQSELLRWHEHPAAIKIETLTDSGRQGRSVSTVVAGTSMAQQDLLPEVLAEIAGPSTVGSGDVYNVGLNGGVPVVMERWLLDEIVPRVQPETVIWGVAGLDLSARYGDATMKAYREAPATRPGVLADLDRNVSAASRLVAARQVLRDPSALWGSKADENRQRRSAAESEVGPDGRRLAYDLDLSAQRADEIRRRLTPYQLDREDLAAMIRTVDRLTALDVRVIFVELPVPPRLHQLIDNARTDQGTADQGTNVQVRFREAMQHLADELDVPFIPLAATAPDGFSDADFVDFTHLGPEAADRFSHAVGRYLAELPAQRP